MDSVNKKTPVSGITKTAYARTHHNYRSNSKTEGCFIVARGFESLPLRHLAFFLPLIISAFTPDFG